MVILRILFLLKQIRLIACKFVCFERFCIIPLRMTFFAIPRRAQGGHKLIWWYDGLGLRGEASADTAEPEGPRGPTGMDILKFMAENQVAAKRDDTTTSGTRPPPHRFWVPVKTQKVRRTLV